mmetsp:Transcript_29168/g.51001  ORF Transcript_29168/g.51001 Transcript_29168/m.51001 type:complete len:518 (-) Transcript_29168:54-1607(-)
MSKKIDEDELKKTFAMFDSSGTGAISEKDLTSVLRALGVKVGANAVSKVLKTMDSNADGQVDWGEFRTFFSTVSDPEEIKALYDTEQSRYFDYKKQVDEDPNFAKTFLLPPSVNSLKSFEAHNDTVEVVCWLSDTTFASAATDGEIYVWDASQARKRPRPIKSLAEGGEGNPIYCMAPDQEGRRLYTGMGISEANLWVWDTAGTESGGCLQKLDGMEAPIYSVAASPDDRHILSGGKKGKICLHDLTGEATPKLQWQAHSKVVYSVRFGPESAPMTMASSSGDGKVKVYDMREVGSGAKINIEDASVEGAVYKVLWRGSFELLSCGDDYCIKRWDIRNTKAGPVANYLGHSSVVKAIELSPDERFLVSSSTDGSVRIWLADEMGLMDKRRTLCTSQMKSLEKQRDKLQEQMGAGVDVDPEQLRHIDAETAELKENCNLLDQVRKERTGMSCIQACAGLLGHSQAVVSLAWRDRADFGASMLTSSTDTTIKLFPVDVEKFTVVSQWADTSDTKKTLVL